MEREERYRPFEYIGNHTSLDNSEGKCESNAHLSLPAPPVFRAMVSAEHSCWKTGFIFAHCVSSACMQVVSGTCTAACQGATLEEWLAIIVLRAENDPN